MKISEIYGLGKSQYELDFIDVDPDLDTRLYIDPYHLERRKNDPWCQDASKIIKNFFNYVLALVHGGKVSEARSLFNYFSEPNETCLGQSRGRPQGRGIGQIDADNFFTGLLNSPAFQKGLITSLEDCRVFVRNIDNDKISDLSTNLIRKLLIDYTQHQCNYWGIPLQVGVETGPYWNPTRKAWESDYQPMLVINDKKRLLVPKAAVVFESAYSFANFYQHYALNTLKAEHETKRTPHLLERQVLKKGQIKEYVTKKRLEESGTAPRDKDFITTFVESYPQIFMNLRNEESLPIASERLANIGLEDVTNRLIAELNSIKPGSEGASQYHHLVKGILELVFYPHLTNPQIEREIHDGRKRIDIEFSNSAESGVFSRTPILCRLTAPRVFVECKNYSRDVANPELDQLSGRFSPQRGQIGIITGRQVDNLDRFLARCSDTYRDSRGLVIPLFDEDLIRLMRSLAENKEADVDAFLQERISVITRV